MKIKLTKWLKVLVFIDFVAVALVVPTLSSYFRDAGMNTQSYGLISSLYSSAQLIGGLVMGILSDHMSKRSILLLSFVGSGVSYLMVGFCKHYFLLLSSRVIVGLVKQTMTTTTLMIAELTEDNHNLRTQEMGHISAISTLSFVIGPSLGGVLYKYDKRLPAVIACSLFFINCCICLAFIPNYTKDSTSRSAKDKNSSVVVTNWYSDIKWKALPSLVVNFLQSKGNLAFMFRFSLLFIQSSMSSRNILNYYEDRFGIETYQLGFISSAITIASLLSQSFLVAPVLNTFRNESKVILFCLVLLVCTNVIESMSSTFMMYLLFSLFPTTCLSNLLDTASKALFINNIPPARLGAMLSVSNVLMSCLGIISPLYGSYMLAGGSGTKGYYTAVHYLILAIVSIYFDNSFKEVGDRNGEETSEENAVNKKHKSE